MGDHRRLFALAIPKIVMAGLGPAIHAAMTTKR